MLRGLALSAIRKIEQKPPPAVIPPALVQDRRLEPPEETDATP